MTWLLVSSLTELNLTCLPTVTMVDHMTWMQITPLLLLCTSQTLHSNRRKLPTAEQEPDNFLHYKMYKTLFIKTRACVCKGVRQCSFFSRRHASKVLQEGGCFG